MNQLVVLIWSLFFGLSPVSSPILPPVPSDEPDCLYQECGLEGIVNPTAFQKSLAGFQRYRGRKSILSIVDFSIPSDQKRFFVIDLEKKKLLLSTWVAHGKNTGMLVAEHFSNKPHSNQSSPGFYRVGSRITSPKHGPALLLFGLEKGINDKALEREIILHGAPYVGEGFIRQFGRCGRSHGCPAIPNELMPTVAPLLADGSLLFIYTDDSGKKLRRSI
jgi:hypothetical protein